MSALGNVFGVIAFLIIITFVVTIIIYFYYNKKCQTFDDLHNKKCQNRWGCNSIYRHFSELSDQERNQYYQQPDFFDTVSQCKNAYKFIKGSSKPNVPPDKDLGMCDQGDAIKAITDLGCVDTNTCQRAYEQWLELSEEQKNSYGFDALLKWGCVNQNICQDVYQKWDQMSETDQEKYWDNDLPLNTAPCGIYDLNFFKNFCDKKTNGLESVTRWKCNDQQTCERAYSEWNSMNEEDKNKYSDKKEILIALCPNFSLSS